MTVFQSVCVDSVGESMGAHALRYTDGLRQCATKLPVRGLPYVEACAL